MTTSDVVIYNQFTGVSEEFSSPRLSSSIDHACRAVGLPDGVVYDTARRVSQATEHWLEQKAEVTTEDIRRFAARHLSIVSAEAGYLYQNEQTIM